MFKLIDFYSTTCRPCRMMDPIVEKIVSQVENVDLEKVNVAEDQKRSASNGITAVPTFVLLNEDGVEVSRKIGILSAPAFRDWIQGHVV